MTSTSLTTRLISPHPTRPSLLVEVTYSQSVTYLTETNAPKVSVRSRGKQRYLTAKDDPVLARIWDNEDDEIYDTL